MKKNYIQPACVQIHVAAAQMIASTSESMSVSKGTASEWAGRSGSNNWDDED